MGRKPIWSTGSNNGLRVDKLISVVCNWRCWSKNMVVNESFAGIGHFKRS